LRILVIGAGAIGGLLAARLCARGHEVAVVARGAHLAALRAQGLTLDSADGRTHTRPAAFATAAEAPQAEVVFVTLKAHQLPGMADDIARACRGARMLVPVQNGVPWWYFLGKPGPHEGRVLRAADPDGRLARTLPAALTVPAFAFLAAEVIAPGHLRHDPGQKESFPLGELGGSGGSRAAELSALMRDAGFDAPVVDVRLWMWNKLLGNVWANPIGALTRATVPQTATQPDSRRLALALMRELSEVAFAHGYRTSIDYEARLDRGASLAGARASMLQDVERGRRTEHEAILGGVVELAGVAGLAVPRIETLLACLRLAAALTPGGAAANNVGNVVSQ
jgi:2-dehydropantoate 2-reductase